MPGKTSVGGEDRVPRLPKTLVPRWLSLGSDGAGSAEEGSAFVVWASPGSTLKASGQDGRGKLLVKKGSSQMSCPHRGSCGRKWLPKPPAWCESLGPGGTPHAPHGSPGPPWTRQPAHAGQRVPAFAQGGVWDMSDTVCRESPVGAGQEVQETRVSLKLLLQQCGLSSPVTLSAWDGLSQLPQKHRRAECCCTQRH